MGDLIQRDGSDIALWSHYWTPILQVIRSETLFRSLTDFLGAIRSAQQIMALLTACLIVFSSISPLLLRGLYQTGDFYTDNQYQTLIVSFSTMYVYLVTGATNRIEK
jgi:hypothetical protein